MKAYSEQQMIEWLEHLVNIGRIQLTGGYTVNDLLMWLPEQSTIPSEITEGKVEVIDILTRLVNLKAHKDKYGKDEIYIKEQPILWDKAKAILATLNK